MNHQAKPKLKNSKTQIPEFMSFGLLRPLNRKKPYLISHDLGISGSWSLCTSDGWRSRLSMNLSSERGHPGRSGLAAVGCTYSSDAWSASLLLRPGWPRSENRFMGSRPSNLEPQRDERSTIHEFLSISVNASFTRDQRRAANPMTGPVLADCPIHSWPFHG